MGIFFKDACNPTGDDYDALDDFFLHAYPIKDMQKNKEKSKETSIKKYLDSISKKQTAV